MSRKPPPVRRCARRTPGSRPVHAKAETATRPKHPRSCEKRTADAGKEKGLLDGSEVRQAGRAIAMGLGALLSGGENSPDGSAQR